MGFLGRYKWSLTLTLVVVAGLVFAFWPRAIATDLETISYGPLSVTVDDDAVTRIKDVYTVTAPVAGRILRVERHAGDVVKQNAVLASILPATPAFRDARELLELEASHRAASESYKAAQSQLESAQADLDYAKVEYKRTTELRKTDATSLSNADQSQRALRRAEASFSEATAFLQQKAAELKRAEAALLPPQNTDNDDRSRCCMDVVAPVSGEVLRVIQESETVVAAGAPLMQVGDPGNLEIVADLLSRDALKVSPGDPVFIENWGGNETLNGKVRLIEPAGIMKVSSLGIEEQRVNVIIDLTDPHEKWKRLGHGYQIDVEIELWRKDHALKVPLGALFRHENEWAVFQDRNGRAQIHRVKIGHLGSQYAEVLEGLVDKDRVILHPSDVIKDGTRIKGREE